MRAETMFNFTTLPANAPREGRKFRVMKREANGFVHSIGTVLAANKTQADYRTRALFGRGLEPPACVWAEDYDAVAA